MLHIKKNYSSSLSQSKRVRFRKTAVSLLSLLNILVIVFVLIGKILSSKINIPFTVNAKLKMQARQIPY